MEVSPSFLDVQRRAIRVEHAMSGNYCLRTQSLDGIQRAQPLTSGLFVALREIRVGIVVDRIPGDHQTNRRHMQRSGVLRVGMASSTALSSSPSRCMVSPSRTSGATNCDGTWPGKRGSQKDFMKSGLIWFCMAATEEAVANALALGNLSSRSFRPKKWSP